MKDSPPEPLMSQIHINFSMSLNLLLSHTPGEVKDLLNRSFAAHQERKRGFPFQARWNELEAELRRLPAFSGNATRATPLKFWRTSSKGLNSEGRRKGWHGKARAEKKQRALEEHLGPGALFVHKNRQVYVVFRVFSEKGRRVCAAHNLRRTLRLKRGQWRLKRVDVRHIRSILDFRVDLHEEDPPEKLRALLASIPLEELKDLRIQVPGRRRSREWKRGAGASLR